MVNPLVSIVTITRNRGQLLKRCIDSVLTQTYSNIEYIIVDGASTDNTDDLIATYKDQRLKYIKLETNWPIAKTINYGASLTTGDYITFLDSDDEYLPNKIEKQLELIQTLPSEYGLVYCWMTYFDNVSGKVLKIHNPSLKGFVPDAVVGKPIVSGTPTYFFRREVFLESGGWKDKSELGIVSDWELAARVCQKWKIDYVPESLINVYVNHDSSTRMSDKKYYTNHAKCMIQFHQYFLSYFKKNFNRVPRNRAYHYIRLAYYSFKTKEYASAFRYVFLCVFANISINHECRNNTISR